MPAPPTRLPEFPASLQFLDRPPLSAATALRGQVAAVLFWRAGCVHSRHALADLAELARGRADQPFAVLAVHVATEPAERDLARVARACAHARSAVVVAADIERALARAVGVAALPTLVLVDGDGDVCFTGTGEPDFARLALAVDALLETLRESGRAVAEPLRPVAPPPLSGPCPTAIAIHGDRVWIASAARRSVIRLSTEGAFEAEVPGFELPAGLVVHDGRLLASDAITHELCDVDDEDGGVETVLGLGHRGADRFGGGFGTQQELCSPVGLCSHEGAVYFAQSGGHQVWQFDPETQAASAWLGTGRRGLADGSEDAAFAEPLGLACDGDAIFVADAGNGAVRAVELAHNHVSTIARGLARPAAVAVRGGEVFVAVSHGPAVVRLADGEAEELCGAADGLVEPVGLAFRGEELWVADAGAPALFVVEPWATPPAVRRVALELPPPPEPDCARSAVRLAAPIEVLEFSDVTLRIHLPCAADERLDPDVPCEICLVDEREPVLAADRSATVSVAGEHAEVLVPIDDRGAGVLRVLARATVRVGSEGRPEAREFRYVVPVTVGVAGALEAEVRAAMAP